MDAKIETNSYDRHIKKKKAREHQNRGENWAHMRLVEIRVVRLLHHFVWHITYHKLGCTNPSMRSPRCSVTFRIKATFLSLTQAWVSATFGPTPDGEKPNPLYTSVVRQASIASPQVTSGRQWESGLYRSIFTVWWRREKNNTTKFFSLARVWILRNESVQSGTWLLSGYSSDTKHIKH